MILAAFFGCLLGMAIGIVMGRSDAARERQKPTSVIPASRLLVVFGKSERKS